MFQANKMKFNTDYKTVLHLGRKVSYINIGWMKIGRVVPLVKRTDPKLNMSQQYAVEIKNANVILGCIIKNVEVPLYCKTQYKKCIDATGCCFGPASPGLLFFSFGHHSLGRMSISGKEFSMEQQG